MDKIFNKGLIGKIKEQAEYVNMAYQRFRDASIENDPTLREAKTLLAEKLDKLNQELDIYQARLYDKFIDVKRNRKKFEEWKKSHQPFHWFAEFYEIIQERGGFDAIIGNPPYVEYSKIKHSFYKILNYSTESCGNLYSYVIEKSLNILKPKSFLGFIVQLPIVCTDRMIPLQNICLNNSNNIWFATFDDRPGKLFDGLEHIRATILLANKSTNENNNIYATNYNRWHSENREHLFNKLKFCRINDLLMKGAIPKIGNIIEKQILIKLQQHKELLHYREKFSKHVVYFHNSPQYWVRSMQHVPYFWSERDGQKVSSQIKSLYYQNKDAEVILSLLNSSLFYWWYILRSDCRHLNIREIDLFPLNLKDVKVILKNEFTQISNTLTKSYEENKYRKETEYKASGKVVYDEYYPKKSKYIIDEIDKVLAEHYGFTEEELDFIINYDIKYRMGNEL
jgi:hypothetical protein